MVRKPKVLTYVCIDGHVSAAGTFREGARLTGDHEAVRSHPEFWVVETATAETIAAQRRAYLEPPAFTPAPRATGDDVPIQLPSSLAAEQAVVCIEGIGMTNYGAAIRAPVVPGMVLSKNDILVRQFPRRFRPVTPPDLPAA